MSQVKPRVRTLQSGQNCERCGHIMHAGKHAYVWLVLGRRHYRCLQPECYPERWETEDDPDVAVMLKDLAGAPAEPAKPATRDTSTAAERAAERMRQIAEIRQRYSSEAQASMAERKPHRFARKKG